MKILPCCTDFEDEHTQIQTRANTLQPKKVHISTDLMNQIFGGEVSITAAFAVGLHATSYQWSKNDELLSATEHPTCCGLNTHKLTISSFTHDYEGKYICSVIFEDDEVVKSNYVELTLGKWSEIC